ncbi:transcriptional regulator, LysR family [Burkholderia sp. OK233]|nr:transcriptional regulator, LysR family [Burkholderia sp. OK233]
MQLRSEFDLRRQLQLRQVEAFKAVIEQGTASQAAAVLHITQPAVSKLLVHLEEETGLALFERVNGRLVPTSQGMRFYAEVDRIFGGLRQLEEAVSIIQRDNKKHFAIGVLPALSGSFIRRVTMRFLSHCPDVYPAVHMRSSSIVSDRVATRQMDVGLTTSLMTNPNLSVTPVMESSLVCIMPKNHALSQLSQVSPADLQNVDFVSYTTLNLDRQVIDDIFRDYGVEINTVLECETVPTLCEFVSAGLGVALTHPLCVIDMVDRLDVRPFKPEIPSYFHFCHARSPANMELVEEYKKCVLAVASEAVSEMLRPDAGTAKVG